MNRLVYLINLALYDSIVNMFGFWTFGLDWKKSILMGICFKYLLLAALSLCMRLPTIISEFRTLHTQ